MGPMRPDRIPLFPLNVVLLPGADLPLHIFEPRYRKMVRDCLDKKSEFGMLLALSDGRAPFRVVGLFTEDPLLEGAVDYLEDRYSSTNPQTLKSLTELYEVC